VDLTNRIVLVCFKNKKKGWIYLIDY